MDISNWSMAKLLELPDYLFGRRYAIGCSTILLGVGSTHSISRMSLPERCVIWEVSVVSEMAFDENGRVSFALGDQLPPDNAAFDALEQLFPDIGLIDGRHRNIMTMRNCQYNLQHLKLGVETQGRRLVVQFLQDGEEDRIAMANIVVSSIPRSLPEWFG